MHPFHLAQRPARFSGTLLSVYHNRFSLHKFWRFSGVYLCNFVFIPHPGHWPLFTSDQWNKAILHPIFRVRYFIYHLYVSLWTTRHFPYSLGLGASNVRRSSLLWCSLYLTDCRSKGYESHCRRPDTQPGVLYFRAGWLDSSRRGFEPSGNLGLYSHVHRNYSSTAPS